MRRLTHLVTFLFPLQSLLAAIGLRYGLYVLLAGGTAAFLLRAALRGGFVRGLGGVWLFSAYVVALTVVRPSAVSMFGLLSYLQFAGFWLAYAYAYGKVDFDGLTRTNLAVATLVAIVGIYQYFLNPTLWGFATYGGVTTYFEAGAAIRINSVMPSAMTLGAYLVVSGLLGFTLQQRGKAVTVCVALCLICAALTGNKSTVLSLGVAALYWLVDRGVRRHGLFRPMLDLTALGVAYLTLLAGVGLWGPWLEAANGTIFRAVAPFFFTGDTQQISFLLAYWVTLFVFYANTGATGIALGNGVGLTRQSNVVFGGEPLGDFPVAESFLVQVGFELGLVGLVLFHAVLWQVFRAARSHRSGGSLGLDHVIVALYANMVVVHVFSGPFLGFMWGYFVGVLASARHEAPATAPELKVAAARPIA